MSTTKTVFVLGVLLLAAVGTALYEHQRASAAEAALAAMTRERDKARAQPARAAVQVAASRPAEVAAKKTHPPRSEARERTVAERTPAAVEAVRKADPARLARYRQKVEPFARQRGLTVEQADRLAAILCDWDEASRDFQAGIRERGLSATPTAQKQRNALQEQIENEPLKALLGEEGTRAYFKFEESSFYQDIAAPVVQGLAGAGLPLNEAQNAQLVALVQANTHAAKKDPTAMASEAVIDWPAVMAAAQGVLTPEQIRVLQAVAASRRAGGG